MNPGAGERCNGADDDCDPATPDTAEIGGRGYGSIAAALAAAVDGDVIELCDGTFEEHGLSVVRAVTVTSFSGDRDAAVIDGTRSDSVFIVDGGSLTLRSITVRNGTAPSAAAACARRPTRWWSKTALMTTPSTFAPTAFRLRIASRPRIRLAVDSRTSTGPDERSRREQP